MEQTNQIESDTTSIEQPGSAAYNRTQAGLAAWFKAGGRGLDTAWKYRNQIAYGDAVTTFMKESGTPRSDIFITTKIPCTGDTQKALDLVKEDVEKLGTTPDLVIIHGSGQIPPFAPGDPLYCWDPGSPMHPGDPFPRYLPCCKDIAGIQATWAGLEQALEQNLTRAIGVSK